jgi:amino acid transporter
MNRFERQAEQTRRASLRNSLLLWSAGGILLIGALALLGYSGGAPRGFWSTAGIVAAVLLLIVRQLGRRLKSGGSRGAKPDEKSMLHLDNE